MPNRSEVCVTERCDPEWAIEQAEAAGLPYFTIMDHAGAAVYRTDRPTLDRVCLLADVEAAP